MPFCGPQLKLDRANDHVREVHAIAKAYRDSNPYIPDTYHDYKLGKKRIGVKLIKPIPREIYGPLGDALHNFQVALDHLACDIAAPNVGNDLDGVYFPIRASTDGFDELMRERKTERRFGVKGLDFFRKVEPYRRGNGHLLYTLRELDKADKHRKLVSLGNHPLGVNVMHSGHGFAQFVVPEVLPLNEHATFIIEPLDAESQHNIQASVNIAITDVKLFGEPEPIFPLLLDLGKAVGKVIELAPRRPLQTVPGVATSKCTSPSVVSWS